MSDGNCYDGLLRAAEEAVCLPAGTLKAEQFTDWLDELTADVRRLIEAAIVQEKLSVPPASPERVGQITAGMINRELDRMMTAPDPCFFTMNALDPDRVVRELGSMVDAVFCRAVLFPLPPRPPLPVEPVHPLLAVYWDPQQGPRPLACDREPHPESPWHWADGTWWR